MNQNDARHIPYLDGWRGLAIAFLLLGHFFPVEGINFGSLGVNLFFVLSGLLMSRILFINKVSIPTFYRRRISRIVPSAFFFVLVITLVYALVGREISWLETVAAMTFTNNYFQGSPGGWTMPLGHIWSLSVEEHSYVVLSVIAVLVRLGWVHDRRAVGIATLIMSMFGFGYWALYSGPNPGALWLHSEVAAFGIFASGFLLLFLYRLEKKRINLLAIPALLAIGMAAHWWSVPPPIRIVIGCGAFALALNLLDRAPALIHALLQFAPLRQLGIWSFSIYLWQQPFYMLVHREGMPRLVGLVASLVVGTMAYYTIEKPARLYLNRVWTGRAVPVGKDDSSVA